MYFAKNPTESIGQECFKKVNGFVQYIKTNGIDYQWEDVYLQYHAQEEGFLQRGIKIKGENAELSKIVINHIRNIVQHILVYSTSNRPAFLTRAINGDAQSLIQASLADGLVNYYLREKRIEGRVYNAAESSLVMGSGYIYVGWDRFIGEVVGGAPKVDLYPDTPPEQSHEIVLKHAGDIECFNPSIYDVFYDPSKRNFDDLDWVIVRRFKNKYELAERYPNARKEILNQDTIDGRLSDKVFRTNQQSTMITSKGQSDDIEYFEFYHKPSLLLPEGRKVIFLVDGTVMEDEKYQDTVFPVFRLSPATFIDSMIGYAPTFDLQGIQEAHNATYGMILTNIITHGLQHVQMPAGTDINYSDLTNGSTVFKTVGDGKGEVKGVNLLNLPAELFKNLEFLEKSGETITGMNAMARGNVDASQRSGAAIAAVQSMAIQFTSQFQNAYARLLEDVGTHIIRLVRTHAKNKRVIEIVGVGERAYLQSFSPETDLTSIDRVQVDIGNPLFRTLEGRQQVADKLIGEGKISGEMYIEFIKSGQLKPLFKAREALTSLISSENDMFLRGQFNKIIVVPTDDHRVHIQEHNALLANPEVRNNPQLSAQVWEHIQEHMVEWKKLSMTAPDLVMALGQQPLAPQMGTDVPMATPPGQGGPQAPTLNMSGGEAPGGNGNRMPTNPIDGQKMPEGPQVGEG